MSRLQLIQIQFPCSKFNVTSSLLFYHFLSSHCDLYSITLSLLFMQSRNLSFFILVCVSLKTCICISSYFGVFILLYLSYVSVLPCVLNLILLCSLLARLWQLSYLFSTMSFCSSQLSSNQFFFFLVFPWNADVYWLIYLCICHGTERIDFL